MNVKYNELNTSDVATILGVNKSTVGIWCKTKQIRFQNVGNGTERPRYMFNEDEVERVSKLIDKYGKRNWLLYNHIEEDEKPEEPKVEKLTSYLDIKPEEYIPDNTDEISNDIKKLRDLKIQRDRKLAELDSLDDAIKSLREKIIQSI